MTVRAHPFDLCFGGFRGDRLPAIRQELADRVDLQTFELAAPALELMRELRPDAGLGEAIDDFVAFVHAAYRFWLDGERTLLLDEGATRALCSPDAPAPQQDLAVQGTQYIQVAPRIIWGQLAEDSPFEPLDGMFVSELAVGISVVACFGVHPDRPGVSVVAVDGRPLSLGARRDGTRLFAPNMPGGDAAHLHAVTSPDELLMLAWRALAGEEHS
jgi:hypothetical protein